MSATAVARSVDAAIADDDDDEADVIDDATVPVRRQGRAGTAIGRAVHATLQLVDLADPRDVDAQARSQCEVESIPEHAEQVAARVRTALTSDAVRLAVANTHYKELYVAAPLGDRVIEGYIDLLIETPDGLVVVDYKTDSAKSEADIDAKLDRVRTAGCGVRGRARGGHRGAASSTVDSCSVSPTGRSSAPSSISRRRWSGCARSSPSRLPPDQPTRRSVVVGLVVIPVVDHPHSRHDDHHQDHDDRRPQPVGPKVAQLDRRFHDNRYG